MQGLTERDADRERGNDGEDGEHQTAPVPASSRLLAPSTHGLTSSAPRA